jgi:tetratricopeptide (TPR) repeat protein
MMLGLRGGRSVGHGLFGIASTMMFAAGAHAADKPVIAPPDAWVKEAPLPQDSAPADQAAVRILLIDQQAHFDPDRGNAFYARTVARIQTAQGLAAFGTIALPWRPDTGSLTIHRIRVIRDGKVIDLATKPEDFAVLRRETNLEQATLDGMLTATLQASGLQVGDIFEMAITVTNRDPAMQGHGDQFFIGWPGLPIGKLRVSADWSPGQSVRWKATDLPVAPKPVGRTGIGFEAENVQPFILPAGAPARFQLGRQLQVTDFTSWTEVSAVFAPLYDKARKLAPDSPLQAEISRIRAASSDPKQRAAAALALVESQVRYVFVGLNNGNLVPADADLTWQRRYGDCKGKTALLLALLDGLGIEAEPTLASTVLGDGIAERLPTAAVFNHILVRAKIDGKIYWLDGTRIGDRGIDDIPIFGFRWTLPVRAKGGALEEMVQKPFDKPETETRITLDASKGFTLPATAHVESVWRGDDALGMSMSFANMAPSDLDRFLRDYWRGQYDFMTPTKVSASFDPRTGEERLILDGTAALKWDSSRTGNAYELDGAVLGWKADFTRAGPNADAPFAVDFPAYSLTEEIIRLPGNGKGFRVDSVNVDKVVAGRHFYRKLEIVGDTMTMTASVKTLQREFPAADAAKAAVELRAMSDVGVFLYPPSNYAATAEEEAALQAKPVDTEHDSIARARSLYRVGKLPEAMDELDRLLKKNPDSIIGLAMRSSIGWALGRTDQAAADVDRLLVQDPSNGDGLRIKIAHTLIRYGAKAALEEARKAVDRRPDDANLLFARADLERRLGAPDVALSDAKAAIALNPKLEEAYLLRANIYRSRGAPAQAAAEANALVQTSPDGDALVTAAKIYCGIGHIEDGLKVFDKALQSDADRSFVFLNRATCRRKTEPKAAMADVDAAIAANSGSGGAYYQKGRWLIEEGDYKSAVALWDRYAAAHTLEPGFQGERAYALALAGETAKARAAFAELRSRAGKDAMLLNQLCWNQAIAGFDLPQALLDCRASVAASPMAANLDSLGFVLLALGKYDEAIASYDKALAIRDEQASSLFGRGLARQRAGSGDKGAADFKAALASDPDVEAEFKRYGQTR